MSFGHSRCYYGPCQSPLSTSTHVVVLDNIFNQKTLSTRQFSLATDFAFSYQVAWPIQIRWREGDTFDALPSTTKSSSGSSSTDPQGGDSSRDSSGGSSGNSLSGGAIAGIVIGALVFVALVVGVVLLVFLLRKRSKAAKQQAAPPGFGQQAVPPGVFPQQPEKGVNELDPTGLAGATVVPPPIVATSPTSRPANAQELDPTPQPYPHMRVYEMDPTTHAYELDATRRQG